MPIENRNLKIGTRLVARYHKQPYCCEVVEGEGEKIRYRLEDGREFKSPSAAGMAITGHACDGWVFWSVETATDISTTEIQQPDAVQESQEETSETEQTTAVAATPAQGSSPVNIFKMEWQKGVPKGQTRWHCNICSKHFLVPTGETPESCPQCHKT